MSNGIVVLYVDDDPAIRDLTAELLERANAAITVRPVADPTAVVDRLDDRRIECLVSDYEMPEMTGLELCDRVQTAHPDLPFFLFTNKPDRTVIEDALAAGVTDFVEKQTGIEHYQLLANRIENAVVHHRDRARLAELSSER